MFCKLFKVRDLRTSFDVVPCSISLMSFCYYFSVLVSLSIVNDKKQYSYCHTKDGLCYIHFSITLIQQ